MNQSKPIQDKPIIRIFADFGRCTGSTRYPKDHWDNPGKYPRHSELIPPRLAGLLEDWILEFAMCATDDAFGNQPGKMLWISFDLKGIKIAKAIKKHVGDRARVVYLKPDEDPFCHYEYAREILDNGEIAVLPNDV